MSVSWHFAGGEMNDLATNRGWEEWGQWVDAIPVGAGFDKVIHLREHGYAVGLAALADQLEKAAKKYRAEAGVLSVSRHLIAAARANPEQDALFVSDDS